MKKIIQILIVFIVLLGCEHFADKQYGIRIRNHSNYSISVYGDYILPDTMLTPNYPNIRVFKQGESNQLLATEVGDPELERFKNEKLTIFIFSTDTLNKYSWNEVVEGYKVLKRYEINQQDLIDMGGAVTYP